MSRASVKKEGAESINQSINQSTKQTRDPKKTTTKKKCKTPFKSITEVHGYDC